MLDELHILQKNRIEMLEERIRQLEAVLSPPETLLPVEWGLTSSEARVFSHLLTRDCATKQSIMMAMYSDRSDVEPEIKIVDVFIYKLRKKLKPFGIEISTIWGQGFSVANRQQFLNPRSSMASHVDPLAWNGGAA